MPAGNRVCCLLSAPLAAVGSEKGLPIGVEGELRTLPQIDTEAEQKNLESALREGCEETEKSIELEFRYATLDALRSVVTLGCRAIHFAGHGLNEGIIMENKRGLAVPASNEALRKLVSAGGRGGVRLVVVNSCHSRKAGESFVEAGVPHVVAVGTATNSPNNRITDKAAASFCRAFYLGLIAGKTIRQAFDIGSAASTDPNFVLLPKDADHEEKIFEDAPSGSKLHLVLPKRSPSNAPVTPTYYIGRNRELFCLVDAMLTHRLTTVSGPYGSGKSALAAAACAYHAERGTFDAIVWVRLNNRAGLVDDVIASTRRVLFSSSPSTHLKNNAKDMPESWRRITSFSLLHGNAKNTTEEDRAATFLREKNVLVVLDDFEKLLVATPRLAMSIRNECQKALASLLAFSKKTKVVLTCSRGRGLGRSTSVTEGVIKLTPLDAKASAHLFLQRCPELARRATNAKAARGPKVPPNVLVSMTARHAIIKRLAGNPLAIALSATLLNSLFDQDDAAKESVKPSVPPKNDRMLNYLLQPQHSVPALPDVDTQLAVLQVERAHSTPEDATETPDAFLVFEPLDRLLQFLDSKHSSDKEDNDIKLRDEINYVFTATTFPFRSSSDEEAPSSRFLPQVSETDDDSTTTTTLSPPTLPLRQLPPQPPPHVPQQPPQHVPQRQQQRPRVLNRKVVDGLAVALACCWLARLLIDAILFPNHALYLRIDALIHFLLDLGLLLLLASFLPSFQVDRAFFHSPTTAPPQANHVSESKTNHLPSSSTTRSLSTTKSKGKPSIFYDFSPTNIKRRLTSITKKSSSTTSGSRNNLLTPHFLDQPLDQLGPQRCVTLSSEETETSCHHDDDYHQVSPPAPSF